MGARRHAVRDGDRRAALQGTQRVRADGRHPALAAAGAARARAGHGSRRHPALPGEGSRAPLSAGRRNTRGAGSDPVGRRVRRTGAATAAPHHALALGRRRRGARRSRRRRHRVDAPQSRIRLAARGESGTSLARRRVGHAGVRPGNLAGRKAARLRGGGCGRAARSLRSARLRRRARQADRRQRERAGASILARRRAHRTRSTRFESSSMPAWTSTRQSRASRSSIH